MGAGLRSEQQDFTTSLGTTGSSMKRAGERGSGRHEGPRAPPCQGRILPQGLKEAATSEFGRWLHYIH